MTGRNRSDDHPRYLRPALARHGAGQIFRSAKALISTHRASLAVSAISAFEIAVKARKCKLDLKLPAEEWWSAVLAHHGIVSIPITAEIALASVALPPHHNDPADRIIIATAKLHSAPLLTSDGTFLAYATVVVEW
jgi:PIN domain nuclease of toxin-antitoxin system